MLVLKERIKVEGDVIQMRLPKKYIGKFVNVTIDIEDDLRERMMLYKIKIDTREWKFNREEIYAEN